jgi:energy-coupling factor transport system ATP-binding protein
MPSIALKDVYWTYAGSKRAALQGITLEVDEGEAVLITGPAGAGKTTLCYTLNGLIPNFFPGYLSGQVAVEGRNPGLEEISELSRIVGLLLQDYTGQLLQPTVLDDVAYALENFGFPPEEIERRARAAIEAVGLNGFERRNPHTLSGGEQQLCAIAGILALDPKVYVLDEPISSLDPLGGELVSRFLRGLLQRREKTFLIVEQRIEEFIPWVDRLVVMYDGRIVLQGKPFDLLNDDEAMEKMKRFGVNVPQLPQLAHELRKRGMADYRLTSLEAEQLPDSLLSRLAERVRNRPAANSASGGARDEASDAIIRVEGLWHIYEGDVVALKDVSLTIRAGEFVAIVGQNGSGKTTLLKHLNGLLKPTRGRVHVFGIDVSHSDTGTLSRLVGLVFQHPDRQLFKLSVRDEVELGMKRLGLSKEERKKRVDEILRLVGLEHAAQGTTFNLSLGERKRLALAATLATDPKVLLVDEPTTGQDLAMRMEIMELLARLNREGRTIVLVTHDMEIVAKYAPRTVVMSNGEKLADGPTRSILMKEEVLERAHLKPPSIARLSRLLEQRFSLALDALTLDEAVKIVG